MHGTVKTVPTTVQPFFPAFDYLRGLAAFGVFAVHADRYHYLPANLGNACVQVFFALSGFLIGGILIRSTPSDLPRFFFNRAARIWIPYAIAIALLFTVTLIKQGMSDPKFGEFFFYMVTFTYNWFGPSQLAEFGHRMPLDGTGNHFWSICVEEQFYLIAPFALLFLRRAIAVAAMAGLVVLNFAAPHDFAAISLGVLLAMSGSYRLIFALGTAAVGAATMFYLPYQAWMPFVAVATVAVAAHPGEKTRLGEVIGGASYPFYLNHWVGLFAISAALKVGAPIALALAAGAAFAIALSVAHFLTIDRAIARHRSGFFTKGIGVSLYVVGIAMVAVGISFGVYHAQN